MTSTQSQGGHRAWLSHHPFDLGIDLMAKRSSAPLCTGLRDNAERRGRRARFAGLEIAHQAVI